MAEYKDIKGFKVQTVSTDPAASIIATGVWASGASGNTARQQIGGVGIKTAALAISGYTTTNVTNVESWNGTSWTEVSDVSSARRSGAAGGTYTSAFYAGGNGTPNFSNATEIWDGTSWTSGGNLGTGRRDLAGRGTQTAGIVFGGDEPPASNKTEEYDGTSWTSGGNLSAVRLLHGGNGTQTAALAFAGSDGFPTADNNVNSSEEYNGTSWTAGGSMNTARYFISGSGSQTSTLAFGGAGPATPGAQTEAYDGTSWTEVADLAIARYGAGGAGLDNTSSLCFFGDGSIDNATEEWTTTPAPSFQKENLGQVFYNSTSDAFKVTRIVTGTGAWASGGTLNTGRQYMGAAGISDTSALIFSGTSPATGVTESYDGSTWTEVNDMSTGRGYLGGGAGTQTAAIAVGGSSPTNPATSGTTEIWDGTSWTTVSSLTRGAVAPQSTVYGSTTGITTSALYIGGGEGTGTDTLTLTEAYNGTSWAEVGDLTTAVSYGAGIGKSDTDALLVTGINWAPGSAINSETNMYYNGTSWTELANVNTARAFLGGGTYGSSTDALIFGGRNQGPSAVYAITESWNGTSWTEVADLGTARMTQGGSGTSASAIYAGGSPYLTITEEWLQPSSTQNQTLTAS
jgi:hypothetical protein